MFLVAFFGQNTICSINEFSPRYAIADHLLLLR
jgi:hypothetical protein